MAASYFLGRRKLYGRIIGVDVDESRRSIHVTVRHLSPVGQILPKTWFDFFMRLSPLAGRLAHNRSKQKPEETKTELLRVQIGKSSITRCVIEGSQNFISLTLAIVFFFLAGIRSPPVSGLSYRPEEWLERLAKQRALVSCQVLARQVSLGPDIKEDSKPPKRILTDVLPELKDNRAKEQKMIVEAMKNKDDQTAVCRITYRPSLFQFFPTDVAEALIKSGNASVSSLLLTNNSLEETSTPKQKALDASERIQDLRKDVQYLDRLAKSEFEAAKASIGMWSVPEVRASQREVVEEVEFQTKANPFQKLWRWFRG
jgi:hypothetical protein